MWEVRGTQTRRQSRCRDQSLALLLIKASDNHTAWRKLRQNNFNSGCKHQPLGNPPTRAAAVLRPGRKGDPQTQGRFTPSFGSSVPGELPKDLGLHLEVTQGKSSGLITM